MIEGELKKRITKAYSEYYRGDGSFGSKITDAIIDDAKKDIRQNSEIVTRYPKKGNVNDIRLSIPLPIWEYWFGDSS